MNGQEVPQQWGDDMFDRAKAERRAYFLMRVLACFTLPFRRRGGGINSPGMDGAVAFLALLLWAVSTHSVVCLRYWMAWTVMLAVYRIGMDRHANSMYEGRSRLTILFKNEGLALALEPVAVILIGNWLNLRFLSPVIIVSGIATAVNELMEYQQRRQTIIAYRDAQELMKYQRELYKRAGR